MSSQRFVRLLKNENGARNDTVLRDAVHAELTELLREGGRLYIDPDGGGPGFDSDALAEVAEIYRANQSSVERGGSVAVVTAGPPGAGKSTFINDRDFMSYLRIDPDEIKDILLPRAKAAGYLDDAAGVLLSDQRAVSPRELAGRVHRASTDVADMVRRDAMHQCENILIEGTLQWFPLAEYYASELMHYNYEHLRIIDIEVPLEIATERARQRWWAGRVGSRAGGRFILDTDIAKFYEDPIYSSCAKTADELFKLTKDVLETVTLERPNQYD